MESIKKVLGRKYRLYKLKFEISQFDRYRKLYDTYSFNQKARLARKWLLQYPEQAHFDINPINYWLDKIVQRPALILEIGGWRGDLAEKALSSYNHIEIWHNYDLLEHNSFQKCSDKRYKLFTLKDDLWHMIPVQEYNALIATHMIEHLSWKEFKALSKWIPSSIKTVLFEAPLPHSDENINWNGDHSSHILEKGWEQVIAEMYKCGFAVDCKENNSVVFTR